jgi:hypothetical protein
MGTNYYVKLRDGKVFHIGKSSFKIPFTFQAIDLGYTTLNTVNKWFLWLELVDDESIIEDEYGKRLTIAELFDIVINNKIYGKELFLDVEFS